MFTEIRSAEEIVMLTEFNRVLDTKFPFLKTGKLFLAISGGKDSMTLSHLLLRSNLEHTLLHCNFKLRGQESDDDEAFIRAYGKENNLEVHVKTFDTYRIAEEENLSIQECARNLRYKWFNSFVKDDAGAYILTAHHLDDSIETFFINLMRGSGFRGLSGIPQIAPRLARPLSDFTGDQIFNYIDTYQVAFRKDSSNAKRDYLRNKIRHDFIPLLAEIEPNYRTKMQATFEEFTQIKGFMDNAVAEFISQHEQQQGTKRMHALDDLLNRSAFFLEQVFRTTGIYRKNSSAFLKFLSGSTGAQFYTQSHHFLLDRERLVIAEKITPHNPSFVLVYSIPSTTFCADKSISFSRFEKPAAFKIDPSIQQVDAELIEHPLTLRTWKNGDKIQPLGMTGTRLISDILIDRKISRMDKENCLVLVNGNDQLICLVGIAIDERFKITPQTTGILEIRY